MAVTNFDHVVVTVHVLFGLTAALCIPHARNLRPVRAGSRYRALENHPRGTGNVA